MRRPWNLVNAPVYSLATEGEGKINMNIATYVIPMSMSPKLYVLGLYEGTRSLENARLNDLCVLQVLRHPHKSLIRKLGKQSGKQVDKQVFLEKNDWLTTWQGHRVLKDCAALLMLKKHGSQDIGGDHVLFWYEVVKYRSISSEEILYTHDLIEDKIIL